MKTRGSISVQTFMLSLITVAIIVQTGLYLAVFGGGQKNTAVAGFATEESSSLLPQLSPVAKATLIIEWSALIIVVLASFIIQKLSLKHEPAPPAPKSPTVEKSKTDLDILYEMIKQNKRVKLSVIMETFNIDEDTAIEWAKILESGELITLHYPRIGQPELILNEEAHEKKEA